MGRKNRRLKTEYRSSLGFNPRKYIRPQISRGISGGAGGSSEIVHISNAESKTAPAFSTEADDKIRRPIRRGEVWFAQLGNHDGTSVQGGCRPVLVISNDTGNRYADTYNVLPMTSRLKKFYLPSHTVVEEQNMTGRDKERAFETSMVLAEQITTIGRDAFRSYLGAVTEESKLAEIETAVKCQLGL